jgi:hypothetical protein
MLRTIFNFISSIAIFALAFAFLRWYIKGHFGKWAIFFWLYTTFTIIIYINNKNRVVEEDRRTGAEVWEEMHRNN